jgi:predicted ATPase
MNELTTFAGRVEELQRLFQCLARAGRAEPQMVLVEGAPGSGRSKLLREFARRLAPRPEVVVVEVRAPEGGAYDPVKLAARMASKNEMYEKVGGRRRARESARELLPDWLGAIPVVGDLIAAIVATVQMLRERRRKKNVSPISGDDDTDALIEAGTRRTLVLLLDDLEKADRAAVARVEAVVRTAEGRARILVAGTTCAAAPGTRPPPVQAMTAALPPAMVSRIALGELTVAELSAWLRKRFPHIEIPDSFLEWLHGGTGGHPAAVEAMLERLITRSVIRFVNRRWEIGETPADEEISAAAVPAIDLSGVKPATVELLETASILGVEFDSVTLSRLAERDELYVEDQLAFAIRHGLVESHGEVRVDDDIATLYRFRSAHLRSALFQALSADRRQELSQRRAALAGPV